MLIGSWMNPAYDYSHGWIILPICIWMTVHSCKQTTFEPGKGSIHGLWFIAAGCMLFVVAAISFQWRIGNGAMPFLLIGAVWYYWGTSIAKKCAFPFFFLWLSIPIPGFQQLTTGMQIMATDAARWGTELCGITTIQEGTSLTLASGNGLPFSIAGGCSGMRSLMALVMISFAWGYMADKLVLWKRLILAFSAIPLAIIANAFRVFSIFVFAEYVNPTFASKTWHDWSGLMFFFPASLIGLALIHGILTQEIPLFKRRRTIIRDTKSCNRKEFS